MLRKVRWEVVSVSELVMVLSYGLNALDNRRSTRAGSMWSRRKSGVVWAVWYA